MKDYYQLTYRGKAKRLKALASKALEAYDLRVVKISLLSNWFNAIYRLDTAEGKRYIIRVVLPDSGHDRDTVQAESVFLSALTKAGYQVPQPIANRYGETVTETAVEGVPQARLCIVFSWIPGVMLSKRQDEEYWYAYGVLSARLHEFARHWEAPADFKVIRYDNVFPFEENCILFEEEQRAYFTEEQLKQMRFCIDDIDQKIQQLFASDTRPIVIHGDLHLWNVKVFRKQLMPIDWEDLQWGYPVQDVGILLYYFTLKKGSQALIEAFQKGYESVAEWVDPDGILIEAFMVARALMLMNVIAYSQEESVEENTEFFQENLSRIENYYQAVQKG